MRCAPPSPAPGRRRLITSRFAYGEVPPAEGYAVREHFYRHARGAAGSARAPADEAGRARPGHAPLPAARARDADVVHFQWLDVQWLDARCCPRRPVVLTAHDLLPREPRPGQAAAQRRLLPARSTRSIVHSDYGRRQLVDGLGLDPRSVHVIHHGAFDAPERGTPTSCRCPTELRAGRGSGRAVLRAAAPVQGHRRAARRLARHRPMPSCGSSATRGCRLEPLRARAPARVRFVPRFVSDGELPAFFRRADVVVLPYTRTERFDQSGVLATALAFGKPTVLSDIGGFAEVAATGAGELVPPGDAARCTRRCAGCSATRRARARLGEAARAAAAGPYSWDEAARKTLALYRSLADERAARPGDRRSQSAAVTVLAILFWVCVGLLVYTHVGYPLAAGAARAAAACAAGRGRRPPPPRDALPAVSVIVAAYAEQEVIAAARREPARARLPAGAPRGDRRLRRLARRRPRRGPARPAPTSCSSCRAAARSARRTPPSSGRAASSSRSPTRTPRGSRTRCAQPRRRVRRPARRLRVRRRPLRQRARDQPGGPLLALRDGAARARVDGCARSPAATARSTPRGASPTSSSTRSWATTCRSRSTWSSGAGGPSTCRRRARPRRWCRRSRASSPASAG